MPTLTTQYVYFGSDGAHTRQPRAVTSYGGFTPIPGLNPSGTATLATATPFQAGPAEPTLTVGDLSLVFAFTSVSGCTEGGLTSQVAGTPPPVGTVGSAPILVLYVYVPVGGGGGNGSGAVIDAFNVTTGALVDNNFVTVTPDSGSALTNEANTDGWVDTTSNGYTITADHPNIGGYMALPTSALFVHWVDLLDPAPAVTLVNGANLTPAKGVSVYALAFYKNPGLKMFKEHIDKNPKEWTKEHIKDFPEKAILDIHPGKSLVVDIPKNPKENSENPGNIPNTGDPAVIAGEIQRLTERVGKLEASLKASEKGSAFIKTKDRPAVGTAKIRKLRDR